MHNKFALFSVIVFPILSQENSKYHELERVLLPQLNCYYILEQWANGIETPNTIKAAYLSEHKREFIKMFKKIMYKKIDQTICEEIIEKCTDITKKCNKIDYEIAILICNFAAKQSAIIAHDACVDK